jgi:hypothetical protein
MAAPDPTGNAIRTRPARIRRVHKEERQMGKKLSLTVLMAAVVALCVSAAVPALASVHVTDLSFTSSTTGALSNLSMDSTGDAGASHGNRNDGTSPIAPGVDGNNFEWFNQNVRIYGLGIVDPDADDDVVVTGAWWQFSSDGTTWGAVHTLAGPAFSGTVAAEGLYSVTATGTDEDDVNATGTLTPAFGIDKTKPVSTSDAVPIYSGTALVTIAATDTLSGIENLQYSVDGGPFDWSSDADPGLAFTVPVTFGPGTHTLTWHAFDNAGNIDSHTVSFIVRPVGFVPSISLNVTHGTGTEHKLHTVKFAGSVSPISTSMSLTVTVQRWSASSGKYLAYTSYTVTVPMFMSSYSLTKYITRDGTYRAKAAFDGRTTSWKKFYVK